MIILDFIGDMGDDLDGFAQVVAPPFLVDDGKVNLAGGQVVASSHAGGGEPFIVAQIQIGLRAVVGDEDLAVLEGVHGARDPR